MSDNNKILNIPQKPHKTVLDSSAMDINLKNSPKKSPKDSHGDIDSDSNLDQSISGNFNLGDPDLTSLEARTYIKENSKFYGSNFMKSLLYPFIGCKYTGFLILIILCVLDKLTLPNEAMLDAFTSELTTQWAIMAVVALCGLLFLILLAQVVNKILRIKDKNNDTPN